MLQWRLWNEMRSQHQPVFCGPAQWSPSQTGLGNLATRGSERGFRFPALWGREGWDDASDLQLQWWKYRSFHHRDPFQGVQSSQKKSQKLSTPLDQECGDRVGPLHAAAPGAAAAPQRPPRRRGSQVGPAPQRAAAGTPPCQGPGQTRGEFGTQIFQSVWESSIWKVFDSSGGPDLSESPQRARGGGHSLREGSCSDARIQTSQEDDWRVSDPAPGSRSLPTADRKCFLRGP